MTGTVIVVAILAAVSMSGGAVLAVRSQRHANRPPEDRKRVMWRVLATIWVFFGAWALIAWLVNR